MELLWLKLCILLGAVSVAEGKGFIETNFLEFENFEGRRFDGKCCDASGWWGGSDDACTNECDHKFVLCMGNGTESSSMSACEFGKKEIDTVGGNRITFNGNVGRVDNPIKFPFSQWPGVVKMKIDVQDDDDDEIPDFVDHYEYQYNTRDLRRETDAPVKALVLTGRRTKFNMELKVFCDVHHFGEDCSIFCQETDDDTGHYRCDPAFGDKICLLGWTGADCLTNRDDCVGHSCFPGATCIDGINYYTCLCPPGRTGYRCEAEINECVSRPCQNGGKCYDATNSFRCECKPGYVGPLCEIDIDECLSRPCLNGGACLDGVDSITCSCQPGFAGDRCEIDINECETSPCVQAEVCVDLPGDYRCECFSGWTGKNCEAEINECLSNPCQNEGICLDERSGYSCNCQYEFTGLHCEHRVDFCAQTKCFNGGTCFNTDAGYPYYICQCPDGFTGFWCEEDLDECKETSDICGDNGKCANVHGNYYCDCNEGYEDRNCETEIDECAEVQTPCLNEGTCVDLIGTYRCACVSGYTGPTCADDIYECISSPCVNSGVCIDDINGYFCNCPLGYSGRHCEDMITSTTTSTTTESTSTDTTTMASEPTTMLETTSTEETTTLKATDATTEEHDMSTDAYTVTQSRMLYTQEIKSVATEEIMFETTKGTTEASITEETTTDADNISYSYSTDYTSYNMTMETTESVTEEISTEQSKQETHTFSEGNVFSTESITFQSTHAITDVTSIGESEKIREDFSGEVESGEEASGELGIISSGTTVLEGSGEGITGSGDVITRISSGDEPDKVLEVESGEVESGEVESGEVESGAEASGELDISSGTTIQEASGESIAGSGDVSSQIYSGDESEKVPAVESGEVESGEAQSGEEASGELDISSGITIQEASGDSIMGSGDVVSQISSGDESKKVLEVESGEVESGEIASGEVESGDEASGELNISSGTSILEASGEGIAGSGDEEIGSAVEGSGTDEMIYSSGIESSGDSVSGDKEYETVYVKKDISTQSSIWEETSGKVPGDSKDKIIDYKEYDIITSGEGSGEVSFAGISGEAIIQSGLASGDAFETSGLQSESSGEIEESMSGLHPSGSGEISSGDSLVDMIEGSGGQVLTESGDYSSGFESGVSSGDETSGLELEKDKKLYESSGDAGSGERLEESGERQIESGDMLEEDESGVSSGEYIVTSGMSELEKKKYEGLGVHEGYESGMEPEGTGDQTLIESGDELKEFESGISSGLDIETSGMGYESSRKLEESESGMVLEISGEEIRVESGDKLQEFSGEEAETSGMHVEKITREPESSGYIDEFQSGRESGDHLLVESGDALREFESGLSSGQEADKGIFDGSGLISEAESGSGEKVESGDALEAFGSGLSSGDELETSGMQTRKDFESSGLIEELGSGMMPDMAGEELILPTKIEKDEAKPELGSGVSSGSPLDEKIEMSGEPVDELGSGKVESGEMAVESGDAFTDIVSGLTTGDESSGEVDETSVKPGFTASQEYEGSGLLEEIGSGKYTTMPTGRRTTSLEFVSATTEEETRYPSTDDVIREQNTTDSQETLATDSDRVPGETTFSSYEDKTEHFEATSLQNVSVPQLTLINNTTYAYIDFINRTTDEYTSHTNASEYYEKPTSEPSVSITNKSTETNMTLPDFVTGEITSAVTETFLQTVSSLSLNKSQVAYNGSDETVVDKRPSSRKRKTTFRPMNPWLAARKHLVLVHKKPIKKTTVKPVMDTPSHKFTTPVAEHTTSIAETTLTDIEEIATTTEDKQGERSSIQQQNETDISTISPVPQSTMALPPSRDIHASLSPTKVVGITNVTHIEIADLTSQSQDDHTDYHTDGTFGPTPMSASEATLASTEQIQTKLPVSSKISKETEEMFTISNASDTTTSAFDEHKTSSEHTVDEMTGTSKSFQITTDTITKDTTNMHITSGLTDGKLSTSPDLIQTKPASPSKTTKPALTEETFIGVTDGPEVTMPTIKCKAISCPHPEKTIPPPPPFPTHILEQYTEHETTTSEETTLKDITEEVMTGTSVGPERISSTEKGHGRFRTDQPKSESLFTSATPSSEPLKTKRHSTERETVVSSLSTSPKSTESYDVLQTSEQLVSTYATHTSIDETTTKSESYLSTEELEKQTSDLHTMAIPAATAEGTLTRIPISTVGKSKASFAPTKDFSSTELPINSTKDKILSDFKSTSLHGITSATSGRDTTASSISEAPLTTSKTLSTEAETKLSTIGPTSPHFTHEPTEIIQSTIEQRESSSLYVQESTDSETELSSIAPATEPPTEYVTQVKDGDFDIDFEVLLPTPVPSRRTTHAVVTDPSTTTKEPDKTTTILKTYTVTPSTLNTGVRDADKPISDTVKTPSPSTVDISAKTTVSSATAGGSTPPAVSIRVTDTSRQKERIGLPLIEAPKLETTYKQIVDMITVSEVDGTETTAMKTEVETTELTAMRTEMETTEAAKSVGRTTISTVQPPEETDATYEKATILPLYPGLDKDDLTWLWINVTGPASTVKKPFTSDDKYRTTLGMTTVTPDPWKLVSASVLPDTLKTTARSTTDVKPESSSVSGSTKLFSVVFSRIFTPVTPVSSTGTPVSSTGMPVSSPGTSVSSTGTPVSSTGTPVSSGMSVSSTGTPVSSTGTPVSSPVSSTGTPVSSGTSVSSTGTPFSSTGTSVIGLRSTATFTPKTTLAKVLSSTIKPDNRFTSEYNTTTSVTTDSFFKTTPGLTPTTVKRSFIRHQIDLTSNNTYPHPRKEIYDYERNRTVSKGRARLTFNRIRVTVIRSVKSAIDTGKRVALQTYQKVKNITTSITVTTYNKARELLQAALGRVQALWEYCETGINHFIVKPLLNAKVFVKERFTNAYERLGEVFKRGKYIFKTTADDFREETQTYYRTLAEYYTGVYRQYTKEVRDIFESLKIPDT